MKKSCSNNNIASHAFIFVFPCDTTGHSPISHISSRSIEMIFTTSPVTVKGTVYPRQVLLEAVSFNTLIFPTMFLGSEHLLAISGVEMVTDSRIVGTVEWINYTPCIQKSN